MTPPLAQPAAHRLVMRTPGSLLKLGLSERRSLDAKGPWGEPTPNRLQTNRKIVARRWVRLLLPISLWTVCK